MPFGGSSKHRQIVRLALAAILAGFILFFLAEVGRAYLTLRSPGWHEWANFTVPADALPLQADIKVRAGGVTLCNLGSAPWRHALVRITDGYRAELRRLNPGKCEDFKLEDFKTNSWKRMPPPRDLVIGNVEIQTRVTAQGYTKWHSGGVE
jgi:hypothetical protein